MSDKSGRRLESKEMSDRNNSPQGSNVDITQIYAKSISRDSQDKKVRRRGILLEHGTPDYLKATEAATRGIIGSERKEEHEKEFIGVEQRRGGDRRHAVVWPRGTQSWIEVKQNVVDPVNHMESSVDQIVGDFAQGIAKSFTSQYEPDAFRLGKKKGDHHQSSIREQLQSEEAQTFADKVSHLTDQGLDQSFVVLQKHNRNADNEETSDHNSSHVWIEVTPKALSEFADEFSPGNNFKEGYFMSRSDYYRIDKEYLSPRKFQDRAKATKWDDGWQVAGRGAWSGSGPHRKHTEDIVNLKKSVVELSPLAPHFANDFSENDS